MSSQLTFLKEVQAAKFVNLKAGLDLNVPGVVVVTNGVWRGGPRMSKCELS